MKENKGIVLAVFMGVALAAVFYVTSNHKKMSPQAVQETALQNSVVSNERLATTSPSVTIHGEVFAADVADTEALREQGLSGRSGLAENQLMLFVFEKAAPYAFWMKGMLFSIDMIWLNSDKEVIYIQKNVSPDTYPKGFAPNGDALYVLELKAGTADRLDIKQGDPVGISL